MSKSQHTQGQTGAALVAANPNDAQAGTAASTQAENSELLYRLAQAEADNYTLIPAGVADKNHTVDVVEPRIERDGFVVAKRK